MRGIEELVQMARKDRNRMKTLVDELIDARWALADMRDVCEPSVGSVGFDRRARRDDGYWGSN